MTTPEPDRPASRTAALVCQGRAAADGRLGLGRFSDPVAVRLLRPDEQAVVEQVRAGRPPQGWTARTAYEAVRASAEVMAARTVAVDDAIRAHPSPQLVVLGAGLDDRAWRMPELDATEVWEVDHTASQRDKRDRLGALEPRARAVRFCAVDFARDDLAAALERSGHRRDVATTWLWEGVVPYLTSREIRATLQVVDRRSGQGSSLVVAYQAPSLRAAAGRRLAELLTRVGGRTAVTSGEPWRSLLAPRRVATVLTGAGFEVTSDEDLLTVARRLTPAPTGRVSLRSGRVAVARRAR
ncbi:class I SAM-dependent methyltransferase [Nocardioides sp.]|uniref:class I SAM-dependent methyltransferase n=1 Tax=Nocardioides sp. TaxID=35761 RepID=UPI002ED7CCB7